MEAGLAEAIREPQPKALLTRDVKLLGHRYAARQRRLQKTCLHAACRAGVSVPRGEAARFAARSVNLLPSPAWTETNQRAGSSARAGKNPSALQQHPGSRRPQDSNSSIQGCDATTVLAEWQTR